MTTLLEQLTEYLGVLQKMIYSRLAGTLARFDRQP